MPTIAGKIVRLEDADVRNAQSPTDVMMIICKDVTLSSSSGDVDLLPYLPSGAKVVSYWIAKQGTTVPTAGVSNILTATAAVAGATATVDVIVIIQASRMN